MHLLTAGSGTNQAARRPPQMVCLLKSIGLNQAEAVWAVHDPGCVKTHTSAKCRKYNSPTGGRAVCAQHDLAFMMRNSQRCFYERGRLESFHTAKTRNRHQRRHP